MLLSEMVRRLKNEVFVYKGSAQGCDVHDWTTRLSLSLSLPAPRLVVIHWDHYHSYSETNGGSRVLLDGNPVWGSGYVPSGTAGLRTSPRCMLMVPGGSHTLDFQTSQLYAASNRCIQMNNIEVGYADFADTSYQNANGSGNVAAGVESSIVSVSIPASSLPARKTAVGKIKQYVAQIYVAAVVPDNAISKLKNVGEANESGYVNWKIFVDDVQMSWNERYNDVQTVDVTKAEGAFGRLFVVFDAETSHTVTVKAYNGTSAARTCNAYVYIVLSPWILGDSEHQPVSLQIPQGSTLYLVAEPLLSDPTKVVKLGKKRAISFGDSTDYYSTASGTGILSWNYTFESVEVSNSLLFASGYGGCISIIAVDVR